MPKSQVLSVLTCLEQPAVLMDMFGESFHGVVYMYYTHARPSQTCSLPCKLVILESFIVTGMAVGLNHWSRLFFVLMLFSSFGCKSEASERKKRNMGAALSLLDWSNMMPEHVSLTHSSFAQPRITSTKSRAYCGRGHRTRRTKRSVWQLQK